MKIERTARGFQRIDFKDDYGEECSLQQSSHVDPHVWLGCNQNGKFHMGEYLSPRMHLSRKQVAALIKHLQKWLDTCSF